MNALATRDTVKRHGLNVWVDSSENGAKSKVEQVDQPSVKAIPSKTVSVILVQGLNADPYYTWVGSQTLPKGPSGSSSQQPWYKKGMRSRTPGTKESQGVLQTEIFWPKDLLSQHLRPARIATYSYMSDWRSSGFKTDIRECGEQLLNVLHQQRSNEVSKAAMIMSSLHAKSSQGGETPSYTRRP